MARVGRRARVAVLLLAAAAAVVVVATAALAGTGVAADEAAPDAACAADGGTCAVDGAPAAGEATAAAGVPPPAATAPTDYSAVAMAHRQLAAGTPPGATRSVTAGHGGGSYALVAPNSRVYGAPPSGWAAADMTAAAVVTPALGAHFSMWLADAVDGATSSGPEGAFAERFLYVLSGGLLVPDGEGGERRLGAGGYAYCPSNRHTRVTADGATSMILIDRVYEAVGGAPYVVGHEDDVAVEAVPGEVFELRRLLPVGDKRYDFNIHVMDFAPGASLGVREVHYNMHGLVMLRGGGIYRLGREYLHVTEGDVLWMGPFTLQWYAALGDSPSRYFLYKDVNRDPTYK